MGFDAHCTNVCEATVLITCVLRDEKTTSVLVVPKIVATVMSCQPPLAGVGRRECPVGINCAMRENACPEVSVDGVSRSGRRVVVSLQDALRLPLTLCLRGAACRERATDDGVAPVSSPRDSQLPHAQERRARRPTPAGQPSASGRTGAVSRIAVCQRSALVLALLLRYR